jgi:hypothetical protein
VSQTSVISTQTTTTSTQSPAITSIAPIVVPPVQQPQTQSQAPEPAPVIVQPIEPVVSSSLALVQPTSSLFTVIETIETARPEPTSSTNSQESQGSTNTFGVVMIALLAGILILLGFIWKRRDKKKPAVSPILTDKKSFSFSSNDSRRFSPVQEDYPPLKSVEVDITPVPVSASIQYFQSDDATEPRGSIDAILSQVSIPRPYTPTRPYAIDSPSLPSDHRPSLDNSLDRTLSRNSTKPNLQPIQTYPAIGSPLGNSANYSINTRNTIGSCID